MRGIVIACPEKYEHFCLESLRLIRSYGCILPVELWEAGVEISDGVREKMRGLGVTFRNVSELGNPSHWKGFQIKAFILVHTAFTEVLLVDADVTFFRNPEILFDDPNYVETGAYFFRDLEEWMYHDLTHQTQIKFTSIEHLCCRRFFIRSLMPQRLPLFPEEWSYVYDDTLPTMPVKEALQESGVVCFHKGKHQRSLPILYHLNHNHKEVYQFLYGDKETFWISCVVANEPFSFNDTSAYRIDNIIYHDYKGEQFWKQK